MDDDPRFRYIFVGFRYMNQTPKVRYLKVDRGRFFYQKRIPKDLQAILGEKMWTKPCGDVPFSKAVQLIVTWSEEHDQFIKEMKSTTAREKFHLDRLNAIKLLEKENFRSNGAPLFLDLGAQDGEILELPSWKWAQTRLNELEILRQGNHAPPSLLAQLNAIVVRIESGAQRRKQIHVPPYPEVIKFISGIDDLKIRNCFNYANELPQPLSDAEFLVELETVLADAFTDVQNRPPPSTDEHDEYEFVRKRLERKINNLKPNPDTLTHVSEKYFSFNQIKPHTRKKYRREIKRLILEFGDVPIKNLEASDLKNLRDSLLPQMLPASLHAVFTPIKGMFKYAIQEGIIDVNPMASISLPRDKRPIEERKWKKFEPHEALLIDQSIDKIWGHDLQGLSEERRTALRFVVRTLMFSGMRPIEVLRLTPNDVTDTFIKISGSKTESSTRVIPLHPELNELPAWLRSGGLNTFDTISGDKVTSVRHNFTRLIRELMTPPISDEQKTLYSLRSTFVNAMRRAGADIQMQRAILGHKEAGAIRHYDDGPEFDKKYEIVARTDPRYI